MSSLKLDQLNPLMFLSKTKEILKKYDHEIVKLILLEIYFKKRKLKKNVLPKNVYLNIKNKLDRKNLRVLHLDLLIEEGVEYINDQVLIHENRKDKKEKKKFFRIKSRRA